MAKTFNALRVLEAVLDYDYFEGVLPVTFERSADDQRLFVVTGPNASGKSFVSKLLGGYVRKNFEYEVMRVGMEFRTGGYGSHIMKALVYGDEGSNSTGLNSYHVVRTGISTCRDREKPHLFILDEPDVGLSESFQGALGRVIAEFAADLPKHTAAFGVVTHSRRLARHLLPLRPHHIRCGDSLTLQEVVEREPEDLTPEEVERLDKAGIDRFRALAKLINER
jgi:hypothetical protein